MSSTRSSNRNRRFTNKRGLAVQGQLPPPRDDVLRHHDVHDRVAAARCSGAPPRASGSTGRGTAPRRCRAARLPRRRTSPRRPERRLGVEVEVDRAGHRRVEGARVVHGAHRDVVHRREEHRASPCAAGSAACRRPPTASLRSITTGTSVTTTLRRAQHARLEPHEVAAAHEVREEALRPEHLGNDHRDEVVGTALDALDRPGGCRPSGSPRGSAADRGCPAPTNVPIAPARPGGHGARRGTGRRPDVLGPERAQVAHRLGRGDVEVAHEQHDVVAARSARPHPAGVEAGAARSCSGGGSNRRRARAAP